MSSESQWVDITLPSSLSPSLAFPHHHHHLTITCTLTINPHYESSSLTFLHSSLPSNPTSPLTFPHYHVYSLTSLSHHRHGSYHSIRFIPLQSPLLPSSSFYHHHCPFMTLTTTPISPVSHSWVYGTVYDAPLLFFINLLTYSPSPSPFPGITLTTTVLLYHCRVHHIKQKGGRLIVRKSILIVLTVVTYEEGLSWVCNVCLCWSGYVCIFVNVWIRHR